MAITLSQLENAIKQCGGDFAYVHGYLSGKGILTKQARVRLGCDYMTALVLTQSNLESLDYPALASHYGLTVAEIETAVSEYSNSLSRRIAGEQTKRKDHREKIATTKSNRKVVTTNAAGDSIQFRCFTAGKPIYDTLSLKNAPVLDGMQRFKKFLNSMIGFKTYSLGANNFEKFVVQGLTITPVDAIAMVEEFHAQKATA